MRRRFRCLAPSRLSSEPRAAERVCGPRDRGRVGLDAPGMRLRGSAGIDRTRRCRCWLASHRPSGALPAPSVRPSRAAGGLCAARGAYTCDGVLGTIRCSRSLGVRRWPLNRARPFECGLRPCNVSGPAPFATRPPGAARALFPVRGVAAGWVGIVVVGTSPSTWRPRARQTPARGPFIGATAFAPSAAGACAAVAPACSFPLGAPPRLAS